MYVRGIKISAVCTVIHKYIYVTGSEKTRLNGIFREIPPLNIQATLAH